MDDAHYNHHKTQSFLLVIALTLLTIITQFADVAFGHQLTMTEVMERLLPSVLFLLILSLPACAVGLALLPRIYSKDLVEQCGSLPKLLLFGDARRVVLYAIVGAVLVGVCLVMANHGIRSVYPSELPPLGHRGALRGLMVSFGAAVGEEVWFRLGITSVFVFVLTKCRRQSVPSASTWGLGILLPGILFGLIHIPQVNSHDALTWVTFVSTVLGNFITSAYFGWCFWRLGLIAAMMAHLFSDLVLHVFTAFI